MPGDLVCPECGADVGGGTTGEVSPAETSNRQSAPCSVGDAVAQPTEIAGWRILSALGRGDSARERYLAERNSRKAVVTLYQPGAEPDRAVYAILQRTDLDHVPEIIDFGHWQGRPYEIREHITGGTLEDIKLAPVDIETVQTIVSELGRALRDLHKVGLRHRDLRPAVVLIRNPETLDLVLDGFGSARLSELDLDVVSPLETTRYMAPEAILGGVTAASDWWSLGMMLLEKATDGACFAGVNERAFLIHVLASGVVLPAGFDPRFQSLLQGLLSRDRHERWGWDQVSRWLNHEDVAPPRAVPQEEESKGPEIVLGSVPYRSPNRYAIAAADESHWDEARDHVLRGRVLAWAEETGLDDRRVASLRNLMHRTLDDDVRLALALKVLNPDMPLIVRGEIITPGWLLANPAEGYEFVCGDAPDILADMGTETWLSQLKSRAQAVRRRATSHEITLNEETFKVCALSTSSARLHRLWRTQRSTLPETDHHDLAAIADKAVLSDEDIILLLSADHAQFSNVQDIVRDASGLAADVGMAFDADNARSLLSGTTRPEILSLVAQRTEGFAVCGRNRIDDWVGQFRLERRTSLARAVVILTIPAESWRRPQKQAYTSQLLQYFEHKVSFSIRRGPLARMSVSKTGPRIDLTELKSELHPAAELLRALLRQSERVLPIDPVAFRQDPNLENRIRNLVARSDLYRRDTGIDSLYLGFPFVLAQPVGSSSRTRIAPFLLWPIRISAAVGVRSTFSIAFDREREEVRLNPALESFAGADLMAKWVRAANDVLQGSPTIETVVSAFAQHTDACQPNLVQLPGLSTTVPAGTTKTVACGVLFHAEFIGQAVLEDLRQLKSQHPGGTALEPMLRLNERGHLQPDLSGIAESDRYFTVASDPTQEEAVLNSREPPGLLVEGPPGTGKSQTIVNIIGDAIGRKRSILVVCQKQAALDVVKKRLEREGLGERIVLITDVNKDRRSVIRMVREQVERIRRGQANSFRKHSERQRTASMIGQIERELDAYHTALHAREPETDRSYRDLVGELVALEDHGSKPIDALSVRKVVGEFDLEKLGAVEEACAPLARLWLESNFEISPFQWTRGFGWDDATLAGFRDAFGAFARSEEQRVRVHLETAGGLELLDPEPARMWLRANEPRLAVLTDDDRASLGYWYPMFDPRAVKETASDSERDGAGRRKRQRTQRHHPEEPPGRVQRRRLDELLTSVRSLPLADHDDRVHSALVRLDQRALDGLHNKAEGLVTPPGFLGRLSPSRYFAKRAVHRAMQGVLPITDDGLAQFVAGCRLERAIRPLRNEFAEISASFGVASNELECLSAEDLEHRISHLMHQIDATLALVEMMLDCPAAEAATRAIRSGTAEAYAFLAQQIREAVRRADARAATAAALTDFGENWMEAEWVEQMRQPLGEGQFAADQITAIRGAAPTLSAFQKFRARAVSLPADALRVFAALRSRDADLRRIAAERLDAEVRRVLNREARLAWKSRLEQKHPALLLNREEIHAKIENLGKLDSQMRDLNRELLIGGIDIGRLGPDPRWEDITRLQGPRTRRLREFVSYGVEIGLTEVRPVWLMNPDTASQALPLNRAMFDLVVYDEASQMPVEYAIPTLYRGKVAVVSGDQKQLPPTSFFSSKVESDEAEAVDGVGPDEDATEVEIAAAEEEWNRREIKDYPDLLALARGCLPQAMLKVHYRSQFGELIAFSNAYFYGNELHVPARHPEETIRAKLPIEVSRVDSVYAQQENEGEAARVVEIIADIWRNNPTRRPSVGIVTFNRRQADLVEQRLEQQAEEDEWFRSVLSEERVRSEDGEDMSLFTKNLENVQGDERDIIVFSTTFGRNAQGTFRRNFGVLGQRGGERRLNVAVTRARSKIVIATSMPVAEISDMVLVRRAPQIPRDYIQAYLQYAESLSRGDLETARAVLRQGLGVADVRRQGDRGIDDGFARTVATYVRDALGVDPLPADDGTAFGLDYAIRDPRTGLFGIGIECDAPDHRILATARAREIWRRAVLSRAIPFIHRVSSQAWYHDRQAETRRLREAVLQALGTGEAA